MAAPRSPRPRARTKVLRPRRVRGIKPLTPDEAHDLLEPEYGPAEWHPHVDATSELVECILSQHTSDLNSRRAFQALRRLLPTWDAVVSASPEAVADAIRNGGLAEQKAPRIQQVLRTIHERTGGYEISFLAEMPLAEAKAWLRSLPGVGPKTTAIVLCFALGLPALPVDTHIYRVARRLALIGPKVTADEAHDVLEPTLSPERMFPFHVYFITHGRRVCKALRPACGSCVLAARCPARRP